MDSIFLELQDKIRPSTANQQLYNSNPHQGEGQYHLYRRFSHAFFQFLPTSCIHYHWQPQHWFSSTAKVQDGRRHLCACLFAFTFVGKVTYSVAAMAAFLLLVSDLASGFQSGLKISSSPGIFQTFSSRLGLWKLPSLWTEQLGFLVSLMWDRHFWTSQTGSYKTF